MAPVLLPDLEKKKKEKRLAMLLNLVAPQTSTGVDL